jgi:hypothetical protein
LWVIKKKAEFSFGLLIKQSGLVILISFFTAIVMLLVKWLAMKYLPEVSSQYLNFVFVVLITSLISALFYLILSYLMGILEIVFGKKFKKRNIKRLRG